MRKHCCSFFLLFVSYRNLFLFQIKNTTNVYKCFCVFIRFLTYHLLSVTWFVCVFTPCCFDLTLCAWILTLSPTCFGTFILSCFSTVLCSCLSFCCCMIHRWTVFRTDTNTEKYNGTQINRNTEFIEIHFIRIISGNSWLLQWICCKCYLFWVQIWREHRETSPLQHINERVGFCIALHCKGQTSHVKL